MTKFSGLNPNGPYLSLEKLKRHEFRKFHFAVRLFAVLYFSVRSSRSRALRYGLPILHESQNYLGRGGGLIPDARPLGTLENQDSRDGKARYI